MQLGKTLLHNRGYVREQEQHWTVLTSGEPINEDVAIANVAGNRAELWVHVHFERPVYIIQEIRADKFADGDVDAFVHGERIQNLQREFERSMD